jgi:hypothetical protein
MNPDDIVFDENYCLDDIKIDGQSDSVIVTISDGLDAADELLCNDYKKRIANFINSSGKWLPVARKVIIDEIGNDDGLELITIFVLFEQNAKNSLFGLLFSLDADREHGRGMMLDGESFNIVKYGDASVAFEG